MRGFARCAKRSKRLLGLGDPRRPRVRGVAGVAEHACRRRPSDVAWDDRAVPVPTGPAPGPTPRPNPRRRAGTSTAAWVEPSRRLVPGDASGQGEARRAASTTCPAARTTTARTPTAATSTRRAADEPTACARSQALSARRRQLEVDRAGRLHAGLVHETARRSRAARACRSRCTISAASPLGLRPTSMSEMLMPASPSIVPTRPIMPGMSSLCTTSMWRAGGRSTGVLVDADDARRLLLAEQRRRDVRALVAAHDDQVHVVARVRRLRLAHRDAALLGELRRVHERHRLVDDRPSTPFRTDSVSTRQS